MGLIFTPRKPEHYWSYTVISIIIQYCANTFAKYENIEGVRVEKRYGYRVQQITCDTHAGGTNTGQRHVMNISVARVVLKKQLSFNWMFYVGYNGITCAPMPMLKIKYIHY